MFVTIFQSLQRKAIFAPASPYLSNGGHLQAKKITGFVL